MAFATVLKYVLIALAIVGVIGVAWWARRHPNRSKEHPDRVRMPKLFLVLAALLVAAGFLMGLAAFTAEDVPDLIPMKIAAVVILLGGLFLLMMYRNWYVAPRADEVAFRTILGREHLIAYTDIVDYRMWMQNGRPTLSIRSSTGAKLRLNLRMYDMTPLLMAIEFRRKSGRWPLRGEMVAAPPSGPGAGRFGGRPRR
ncbi:hypothetical protein J2Y69_001727 [Microbacterium resistens]|uniref:PH domain-containing protein n=1 Tax=Microbacterium resistens TaxID=156977 RepID=A0ABU1SE05_9MICO|nr:hypothetical protein [Microbacterium resistens]MDR6867128.1 hypothetical protein [Microbacterium resistens]